MKKKKEIFLQRFREGKNNIEDKLKAIHWEYSLKSKDLLMFIWFGQKNCTYPFQCSFKKC